MATPGIMLDNNNNYANALGSRYSMGNEALQIRKEAYTGGIAIGSIIGILFGCILLLAAFTVSKKKGIPRAVVIGTISDSVTNSPVTNTYRDSNNNTRSETNFNCSYNVNYKIDNKLYTVMLSENARSSPVNVGEQVNLQYDIGKEANAYLCCKLSQKAEIGLLTGFGIVAIVISAVSLTFRSKAATLAMAGAVKLT